MVVNHLKCWKLCKLLRNRFFIRVRPFDLTRILPGCRIACASVSRRFKIVLLILSQTIWMVGELGLKPPENYRRLLYHYSYRNICIVLCRISPIQSCSIITMRETGTLDGDSFTLGKQTVVFSVRPE